MTLLTRVLSEKRALVLPLVVALVLNLLAYVLVVRPLGVKSAGTSDRAAAAALTRGSAERELAQARRLVEGKSEAEEELSAFYRKVLPADLVDARRMTYASLPALASKAGVRYEQRSTAIEPSRTDDSLGHMSIRMVLRGEYPALRQFIYALERAPEFVILDDVTLTEAADSDELTLAIGLSTYYRLGPNGS